MSNMEKMDRRPIVLMDLDNTILDFNTAERRALRRAFETIGLPYTDDVAALYHTINIRHWEMLEDGILTRAQVLVMRYEALYRELGIDADAERTQALYEGYLAEGHWFMPGAEEMLRRLRGKCRLFICSNGTQSVQEGRIASDKPDARYFEACFSEIPGFDRERAIILGDSLTSDIRGGKNANILTCWYNPDRTENRSAVIPDYEICELSEFEGLLGRIFCK